jgi:hypothetical protein
MLLSLVPGIDKPGGYAYCLEFSLCMRDDGRFLSSAVSSQATDMRIRCVAFSPVAWHLTERYNAMPLVAVSACQPGLVMSSRSIDAEEFQDFLAVCRRRFISHSLLRGLSSVVLITVGAILFAGLFDFLIPLPGYLRLILLLSALALCGLSMWKDLWGPLWRGISETELGAAADLACPDLDEALATLVSVESADASPSEAGSALMRQKLWQQTRPRLIPASRVPLMEPGSTARRCGAAASIMLVTLVPLFAWQSGSLLLLQRFLMPLNNHPTGTDLYFAIQAPGDVVARGEDVVFQATPLWRSGAKREPPTEVTLLLESDSGHTDSLQMRYDDEGFYAATLRDISSSLRWQINTGRTATEYRMLRVVDRPQLADAVLTVTPPEYTGLAPQRWPGITGTIDALHGSELKTTLASRAPIVSAELIWLDDRAEQFDIEGDAADEPAESMELAVPFEMHADGTSAEMSFVAERGGVFQLRLTDQYGIRNHDEQHRQLRLLTDEPPTLSVRGIRSQETLRPDAIVPINVVARDDIGLTSLELHTQQTGLDANIIPAGDFASGSSEFEFEFRANLSELSLTDGDEVQIRVRTTDGCVPDSHVVWSDTIRIQIDSNAEPVGADAMDQSTRKLLEQLESVRQELRNETHSVKELKRQAQDSWTESSRANTARLSEQEQQHGRQLEDIARQAGRHPLMASPAADIGELASTLRQNVVGHLNDADTAAATVAAEALERAEESLITARAELDRIMEQIEQAGKLEQDLAELNRLALGAEQLANDAAQHRKQPDPDNEASSAESKRIESERRNLTDDLTKLLAEQSRLREAAQQAVRDRLNKAAEQAASLASRQQQISDGVAQQADERGDSIAPDLDEAHAGTENLLNRIEDLAHAAQQMSQAIPSQTSTNAAEQLRTAAAGAAELSRTGQFEQSANLLREAADAALLHQQQAGNEMSLDQTAQSSRLRNQLKQAANLIADLEQNEPAQRSIQRAAQSDIAAATQSLASELSQVQEQIQLPALDLKQEQSNAIAAAQSSMKAQDDSGNAADQLPTGRLRDAADSGAQAAAALRRVAEVGQQKSENKPKEMLTVPTQVGQSVTDALQNLSDAAQQSSSSVDDDSASSDSETSSGNSDSQSSNGAPGTQEPAENPSGHQSSDTNDGDPVGRCCCCFVERCSPKPAGTE